MKTSAAYGVLATTEAIISPIERERAPIDSTQNDHVSAL